MRYLIDKNTLTNRYTENLDGRDDIFILQEVIEEAGFLKTQISAMIKAGVHIVKMEKRHLEKLKLVLSTHGKNLELINLYTGKGMADVAMISFILAEKEMPATLFPEEFVIITKDKGLISVCSKYEINCLIEPQDK